MNATDPLDVPCTYCHQPAGDPCRQSRHRWYGDIAPTGDLA